MPITVSGTTITFNDATTQTTAATGFAATTAMLFVQTSAPTGWTKSTTHDNKALRIVSGVASSGGSVAFTTAFASGLSASATTLSTAQMPSHSHSATVVTPAGGVSSNFAYGNNFCGSSTANTASAGSGSSHTHSMPSFAVQYVDVIIATKD